MKGFLSRLTDGYMANQTESYLRRLLMNISSENLFFLGLGKNNTIIN